MLEFRPINYNTDIEEVVELIQKYLQPAYTKEILAWKHLNNPFGSSYSMVATYNQKIVGVVFYMRYNFFNGNGKSIKCIRPFDGCTASEMRGKGIFKRIMVACLEQYKNDYELLLANPNSNSYPEFLKLGWKEPSHSYVYNMGVMLPKFTRNNASLEDIQVYENSDLILSADLKFFAGNSLQFIQWRYEDPIYKKKKYILEGNIVCYIIYRIDLIKGLKTVVLCDYFGESKVINTVVKIILKNEGTIFIYYLHNILTAKLKPTIVFKHKKALIVYKENNYVLDDNLIISLGDLEGRL